MFKYKYLAATVAIAIIAVAIATFVIRDFQFVDVYYIAHIRQFHYYPPSSFVSLPGTFFTILFPSLLSYFTRLSRRVSTLSSFQTTESDRYYRAFASILEELGISCEKCYCPKAVPVLLPPAMQKSVPQACITPGYTRSSAFLPFPVPDAGAGISYQ